MKRITKAFIKAMHRDARRRMGDVIGFAPCRTGRTGKSKKSTKFHHGAGRPVTGD